VVLFHASNGRRLNGKKNTAPASCEHISTGSTFHFWRFNRITPWLDFKQLNSVVYFNTKSKN
jgi:hypothetical protein